MSERMETDARSRAYGAAADALWGQMHLLASEEAGVKAIDAALADGAVRLADPGEPNVSVEAYWRAERMRSNAERHLERAEDAVERYGVHDYSCPAWNGQHCVCGYAKALDRARRHLDGEGLT